MTTETEHTDLSPKQRVQRWLELRFPGDIHVNQSDMGYFAGSSSTSALTARLYYYGGSRMLVENKLRKAARLLDEQQTPYTWEENAFRYKYLLVECYSQPEAEPEPDVEALVALPTSATDAQPTPTEP